MKPLSDEAQALIAQTRQLDEPTLGDRLRLRERLDVSWTATSAAPQVGASLLKGKLLLSATSFVAVASAGIFVATTNPAPPSKPTPAPAAQLAAASASRITAQPFPELEPGAADARAPESAPARALTPAPVQQSARGAKLSTPASSPQSTRAAKSPAATFASQSTRATKSPASAPAPQDASSAQPSASMPQGTRSEELSTRAPRGASASTASSAARTRSRNASAQEPADELAALAPSATEGSSSELPQPKPTDAADQAPRQIADERPDPLAPAAIGDEVMLLGAAQKELRAGQPSRALGYIQQHAFRFPTGALAQERAAVQALALCALNRKTAARQVFEDLARRAPSAAVLPRIRRDCDF